MDIDQVGIALLEGLEGCVLHAYKDIVGVWTIGVGHAIRPGDGFSPTSVLTQDEADALLRKDVSYVVSFLNDHVSVPLTQGQFNACVSLAFNIGCGAFSRSSLLARLNEGNYSAALAQFGVWRMAGGKPCAVLERRRVKEAAEFVRT